MINEKEIFSKHKTSLKETSKDTSNNEVMTNSELEVINFDKVKKEYVRNLGMSTKLCSNDALFMDNQGMFYFIEFKNGSFNFRDGILDNKEKYAIWLKIYDSFLIFSNITSYGTDFTCENLNYILVYNEGKNASRDFIAKKVSGMGNMNYKQFGLDRFEKLCFKEVFTYDKQEFEDKFVSKFVD